MPGVQPHPRGADELAGGDAGGRAAGAARRPWRWHTRRCAARPHRSPSCCASSICFSSGSMNAETNTPAPFSRLTASRHDLRLARQVQPALGGHFLPALGHQRRLVGHRPARRSPRSPATRLISRFSLHCTVCRSSCHIAVVDVPAVLAQVDGDAVGPAQLGLGRRPDRVRLVGPPGLPQRGHVIDIDAQFDHRGSILGWVRQDTRAPRAWGKEAGHEGWLEARRRPSRWRPQYPNCCVRAWAWRCQKGPPRGVRRARIIYCCVTQNEIANVNANGTPDRRGCGDQYASNLFHNSVKPSISAQVSMSNWPGFVS